jgi:hypothetical protein
MPWMIIQMNIDMTIADSQKQDSLYDENRKIIANLQIQASPAAVAISIRGAVMSG